MKQKLTKDRVFSLRGYTVKVENGLFYVAATTYHGDKPKWSKGYKSLQSATAAIARKLGEEFTERNKRLERA